MLAPKVGVDGPAARHHHGAGRDLQRGVFGRADDRLVGQVVHARRPRQDDARRQHGALAYDRPLVDAAAAADEHVVLDHDRRRADGLQHAADLGRRRQVDALADLPAAAYQRVAVHHRPGADVGAHVDVHRRHAHDARREVRPAADRRAARHDADAAVDAEALDGVGVLVEKGELVARQVHDLAEPEAEQDAALDPAVGAPHPVISALGGTHLARLQRVEQALERRAGPVAGGVDVAFDVGLQVGEVGHGGSWERGPKVPLAGRRRQRGRRGSPNPPEPGAPGAWLGRPRCRTKRALLRSTAGQPAICPYPTHSRRATLGPRSPRSG